MKKILTVITFGLLLLGAAGIANSAVVDVVSGGGTGYFYDTETKLLWYDVDSFLGMTIDQVVAAVEGTGFHLASQEEIEAISGINATTILYMGGSYDTESQTTKAYGLAAESMMWDYGRIWLEGYSNMYQMNIMPAETNQAYSGYGAWVVSDHAVPIPSALYLLGVGVVGIIGVKQRKN